MSEGEHILLFLTFWVVALTLGVIVVIGVAGPPRSCRYLVPVRSHPGVLACSEHPRAKP